MKKVIDTQTVDDPNLFGEILREHCFKESYGCYTCFELIDGFKKVGKDSALGIKLLTSLALSKEQLKKQLSFEEVVYRQELIEEYIKLINKVSLYSNGSIHIAWLWEGDGELAFIEGDKCAVNTDCKKDYGWQWKELS